jgi:hypothetical protein
LTFGPIVFTGNGPLFWPPSGWPTIRMSARQALYVIGELTARTKATRKTIEPSIPENCPLESSFWTK